MRNESIHLEDVEYIVLTARDGRTRAVHPGDWDEFVRVFHGYFYRSAAFVLIEEDTDGNNKVTRIDDVTLMDDGRFSVDIPKTVTRLPRGSLPIGVTS